MVHDGRHTYIHHGPARIFSFAVHSGEQRRKVNHHDVDARDETNLRLDEVHESEAAAAELTVVVKCYVVHGHGVLLSEEVDEDGLVAAIVTHANQH